MTRHASLRCLPTIVAVVAAFALAGASVPASATTAMASRRAPRHTAKELADFLASMRPQDRSATASTAGPPAAEQASATVPRVAGVVTSPTLAYVKSIREPNNTIDNVFVRDLITGATHLAASGQVTPCADQPRISPDGTMIAYLSYGLQCRGRTKLNVANLTTGGLATLLTTGVNTFLDAPNWSADSSTILFTQWQTDGAGNFLSTQLYTVPGTGGTPTALPGGGVDGYDGVYSPDGTKIVFAPENPLSDNFLAVMDADGNNVVNLTTTAQWDLSPVSPAWSPDGTRVSFTYDKPGHHDGIYLHGIGVAHVDDSSTAALLVTSRAQTNAFYSSWSSDGTEIFYDALLRNVSTGVNLTNSSEYATDATGHRRATVLSATNAAFFGSAFGGTIDGPGSPSTYTPVTPTRLLAQTPVGQFGIIDVQVAGGSSPVPAGATAVTLNVTGVSPTQGTYLQVYPTPDCCNSTPPTVSNLNLTRGQIAAVAVQVGVSSDGHVRIGNYQGITGVIVDVSGYFSAGTSANSYTPIAPTRAVDTTLGEDGTTDVTVTGLGAPNPGFTPVAVVLNLTAAGPTKGTYLSAYPTPATVTTPPAVSNLNLAANAIRANLVTVPIGDSGRVTIHNAFGSVRAIADVVGYYGTGGTGGLAYYPLQPTRFMDTRVGTDTWVGGTSPLGIGVTLPVQMRGSATTGAGMITVPATAKAYVYNLTAVSPTSSTYLTAFPAGSTRPLASTLNAAPGTIVPNLAITGTDSTGTISIYNLNGKTPILVDLAGYYAP